MHRFANVIALVIAATFSATCFFVGASFSWGSCTNGASALDFRAKEAIDPLNISLFCVTRDCRESHEAEERLFASLKSRRIVLLGDSVTRYQYIALIFRLSQNKWAHGPQNISKKTQLRLGLKGNNMTTINDVSWGQSYADWHTFLQMTNDWANSHSAGKTSELCDCSKNKAQENRFFVDDSRNLQISFLFSVFYKTFGYRLADEVQQCSPVCTSIPEQRDDILAVLPTYLQRLRPDFIIINQGLWKQVDISSREDRDLFGTLIAMCKNYSKYVIWKTTTLTYKQKAKYSPDNPEFLDFLRERGVFVFDTFEYSLEARMAACADGDCHGVFTDDLHFADNERIHTYRYFNLKMMQFLAMVQQQTPNGIGPV